MPLGVGCTSLSRSPSHRQPEDQRTPGRSAATVQSGPSNSGASNQNTAAVTDSNWPKDTTPRAALSSTQPSFPFEQPGSTERTIACGRERCIAGRQTCAQIGDEKWECVDIRIKTNGSRLNCDDASDCARGLACCTNGATAELSQVCTPRSGPNSDCAQEVCAKGEGAPCPKGLHCLDRACVGDLRVTCPGSPAGHCGPESYCEWKSGVAHCVTEPDAAEAEGSRGVFACTRPADCGRGRQCCTSSISWWHMTGCSTNCDITNSTIVCDTVADCRRKLALTMQLPPKDRHRAVLSCVPVTDADAPPWLRTCELKFPDMD